MVSGRQPNSIGWRARLTHWTQIGLDLLFPAVCCGCGALGDPLCPTCAQQVTPVSAPICAHCGRPLPHAQSVCTDCARLTQDPLTLARAATLHTSPMREAIHALKYENRPELGPYLARYLIAVFAAPPWTPHAGEVNMGKIDAVVPVPLHAERLAERGYNQSELLAASFCAATGLHCAPAWLARIRATRQQVGLGPEERHANVADAFDADPAVAGQTLLLIDDVRTTGATLRACATAALAAQATAVYALTLAIPLPQTAPLSRPPGQHRDT